MKPGRDFPAIDGTENPFEKQTEAQKKKIDMTAEKQKEDAETGYQQRIDKVLELKGMTDTKAWSLFAEDLQIMQEQAKERLLNVEKTRDIVDCQQRVKIIDAIFNKVRQPVYELNDYIKSMPLFKESFKKRAAFTDDNKVEIIETK
jgi:hypothetical protein